MLGVRLWRDTRGALLTEYIVLVVVALTGAAGAGMVGLSIAKSFRHGGCIAAFDSECDRASAEDGPLTGRASESPAAVSHDPAPAGGPTENGPDSGAVEVNPIAAGTKLTVDAAAGGVGTAGLAAQSRGGGTQTSGTLVQLTDANTRLAQRAESDMYERFKLEERITLVFLPSDTMKPYYVNAMMGSEPMLDRLPGRHQRELREQVEATPVPAVFGVSKDHSLYVTTNAPIEPAVLRREAVVAAASPEYGKWANDRDFSGAMVGYFAEQMTGAHLHTEPLKPVPSAGASAVAEARAKLGPPGETLLRDCYFRGSCKPLDDALKNYPGGKAGFIRGAAEAQRKPKP